MSREHNLATSKERESAFDESPPILSRQLTSSSHILNAARHLRDLDEKLVNAVQARIESDLRTGYAFTRFLTTNLRTLNGPLAEAMISYGMFVPTWDSSAYVYTATDYCRIVSISYSWLCCGPVFQGAKLRA